MMRLSFTAPWISVCFWAAFQPMSSRANWAGLVIVGAAAVIGAWLDRAHN